MPGSIPDSATLARLLRQLDIMDVKRMNAARNKFDLQELSRVSNSDSSIPNPDPLRFNTDQALSLENEGKNRYSDILSYDEALLPSPYLNASLIPPPINTPTLPSYISTQAPLPSTYPQFFHHIISQKVSLILMLTPLVEGGRRKAERYWPTSSETRMDLGSNWSIELLSEKVERDEEKDWECWFRRVKVKEGDGDGSGGYEVDQIQITSWADHGASSEESLERILDLMDQYTSNQTSNSTSTSKPSSILVHCSAGVGRSGTVIASHILRHIKKNNLSNSSILDSINSKAKENGKGKDEGEILDHEGLEKFSLQLPFQIVKYIRDFRPRMVQTGGQLEMVWNSSVKK